jgi:hypothetical protein
LAIGNWQPPYKGLLPIANYSIWQQLMMVAKADFAILPISPFGNN